MKVKLEEVCKRIYAGGDVPKDSYSKIKTDEYSIPIYANAEKDDGLYGYTDKAREEDLSITVAARGTIGYASIRREPFLPVVRLITVVPDTEKVSERYLYYVLKQCKPQSNGTSIPQLTVPDIKKNSFELYEISEQIKIADRLDKVSKLINLRRQELFVLDNLVKARFVEMFGDPTKNPKGWEVVTIGDIVTEVKYGTSKPAVEGGKYPYLRMNNLTSDGHLDLNDLKYIDISEDEIEKYVVRKGDVLFNRTNSIELVGKTAVFDLPEDMVIAGYIIRVRLNERMLPEVLSQYMNLGALKDMLRSMAKGAVNQANINAQELQSIKVYIPDMELQKKFIEMKKQVDKSKVTVQKALEQTQTLFDSLMQKYFG